MPFTKQNLEQVPISFSMENEASVRVGPCSVTPWEGKKIPMDGRRYELGGSVILKNGLMLRASFEIDTTTFDFLIKPSTYIYLDEVWYGYDEPELLEKLGLTDSEAFPAKWLPDRELDYWDKGPYKFDWYSDE